MLRKYTKSLKVILSIILWIAFALVIAKSEKYIRRLVHIPKTFETVDNSSSELLNMLVNKSKFSNKWQWDLITTNQFNHVEYDTNIKERAIRSFLGYYNGHDVRFTHAITKYIVLPNEFNVDPMWKSYGVDTLINQVSISTPQNSTFLPPPCYNGLDKPQKKIIRCVLVREYRDIQERIDLDVYGDIKTETVSQFVNNIVAVFDDKEASIK